MFYVDYYICWKRDVILIFGDLFKQSQLSKQVINVLQGQVESLTAEQKDAVYKSMVLENDKDNLSGDLSVAKVSLMAVSSIVIRQYHYLCQPLQIKLKLSHLN